MSERFDFTGDELAPAYRAAVDAIEAGDLVVLPTDTVYGLAADAFKSDAVQRLLDAKGRGRDVPPPVLISVVESLDALATDVPDAGRKLCEKFWPGPLTVICHAQGSLMWDLGETQGTVALRVPDHENTRELLSRTGPLAVTSAAKTGGPAVRDVYDAEEQLGDAVAVYLDGGETPGGPTSTIIDLTTDTPRVVRIGAITLAQLREAVPEVTTDDDPTDGNPVTEPAAAPPVADENPAETIAAPAADEKPTLRLTDDNPAAATPVAGENPAAATPVADGKSVVPEAGSTETPVDASKQDEKRSDPDARPAD